MFQQWCRLACCWQRFFVLDAGQNDGDATNNSDWSRQQLVGRQCWHHCLHFGMACLPSEAGSWQGMASLETMTIGVGVRQVIEWHFFSRVEFSLRSSLAEWQVIEWSFSSRVAFSLHSSLAEWLSVLLQKCLFFVCYRWWLTPGWIDVGCSKSGGICMDCRPRAAILQWRWNLCWRVSLLFFSAFSSAYCFFFGFAFQLLFCVFVAMHAVWQWTLHLSRHASVRTSLGQLHFCTLVVTM